MQPLRSSEKKEKSAGGIRPVGPCGRARQRAHRAQCARPSKSCGHASGAAGPAGRGHETSRSTGCAGMSPQPEQRPKWQLHGRAGMQDANPDRTTGTHSIQESPAGGAGHSSRADPELRAEFVSGPRSGEHNPRPRLDDDARADSQLAVWNTCSERARPATARRSRAARSNTQTTSVRRPGSMLTTSDATFASTR